MKSELYYISVKLTFLTLFLFQFTERGELAPQAQQKESGYDFKIKLLREELQRLEREKFKSSAVFSTAFAI